MTILTYSVYMSNSSETESTQLYEKVKLLFAFSCKMDTKDIMSGDSHVFKKSCFIKRKGSKR